jgi:hypothetical protein
MDRLAEFEQDFFKSDHYQPGDKVTDVEARVNRFGSIEMSLYFTRDGKQYKVPFYYDQDPSEDDLNIMEKDEDDFIDMMSGATEWVEWMNNVELEEV